jgi:hypothetical protein
VTWRIRLKCPLYPRIVSVRVRLGALGVIVAAGAVAEICCAFFPLGDSGFALKILGVARSCSVLQVTSRGLQKSTPVQSIRTTTGSTL